MTNPRKERVLVLGATGMLGNAMFRFLATTTEWDVWGTIRTTDDASLFPEKLRCRLLACLDAMNTGELTRTLDVARPTIVVNCIGVVKQHSRASDPVATIEANALLPHRLAQQCLAAGSRLLHFSTDCVFSGAKGNYNEDDVPDANDLYGRSKLLGEVDYPHALTLRTSMIGHELRGTHGLVGWFLDQRNTVKGYQSAFFSGLPTVELAAVIRDFVIPERAMRGIYHVAAAPISKYDLLRLVRDQYKHDVQIEPDDELVINRSLDARRFNAATGYVAPSWDELVRRMYNFQ